MSYLMDEAQTLNYLARRIHDWAVSKKFYDPCPACKGVGHWVFGKDFEIILFNYPNKDMTEVRDGEHFMCTVCQGKKSAFDPREFLKFLLHINGEVDEAFQLTRLHTVEQLKTFAGRPGVVATPGYRCDSPCVPEVPDKNLPGHPALAVELADIIIRTLDTARWLGLDIGAAVMDKITFNDSRPEKHNKLH